MAEPPPASAADDARVVGARRPPLSAVVVLVVALAGVFLVQFALSGWAEGDALHHDVQHGLLFACGILVGGAAVATYRTGADRVAGSGPETGTRRGADAGAGSGPGGLAEPM
ncbi:MAG TPA: hypothetical protein VE991_15050 [Acidimicrobiales bacterium]|nr:hypothetical protein [Acidimicrobiales bacterium]